MTRAWDAWAAFLGALLAVSLAVETSRAPGLLLEEGLEVVEVRAGGSTRRVVVVSRDAGP